GLYLRAALAELRLPPAPRPEARERLELLYDRVGAERAHELLAERDPGAAAAVHPNDRRRVVRALELAEAGSSLRPSQNRLWAGETRHPTLIVGLELPREELRRRIADRAREMFDRGVEEAELDVPLTPESVKRICDYHFGVGSDGILEVVSADGDTAEVVIWNPDGSVAELSGNGTRIAARWLARRSGSDRVRILVGPRI